MVGKVSTLDFARSPQTIGIEIPLQHVTFDALSQTHLVQ